MIQRAAHLLRLQAAWVLLILLVSGPLVPLASAAGLSSGCSMACCVEEGFCCCNSRDTEDRDAAASPEIGNPKVAGRCPDDCAAPGQISRLQSRDSLRAASYIAHKESPTIFGTTQDAAPARPCGSTSSAPRAPPAFLSAYPSIA
ncbi:MAG TPA: hypothetical protein VNH22_21330 [Blastocatellia bacterium]|nr:hypothetical protein [Blastocatellia bacterium]